MAAHQVELAGELVTEAFSPFVSKVAVAVASSPCTLREIMISANCRKPSLIKKCLCALIYHQFVTASTPDTEGPTTYTGNVKSMLRLAFFPFYERCVSSKHGHLGEILLNELLACGRSSLSFLVRKSHKKLKTVAELLSKRTDEGESATKPTVYNVRDTFIKLVDDHVFCRVPSGKTDDETLNKEERNMYKLPEECNLTGSIPLKKDEKEESSTQGLKVRKRTLIDSDDEDNYPKEEISTTQSPDIEIDPDGDILWQVDFVRLDRMWRDTLISNGFDAKIDQKAASIISTILHLGCDFDRVTDSTKPVDFHMVFGSLPLETELTRDGLHSYIQVLLEDSDMMLTKFDGSGGGTYTFNIKRAITTMCEAQVESHVEELYGSKALRMFRLLTSKKYLTQEELEQLAMVPSKEAKTTLYDMVLDGIVTVLELPRTNDYAPSRTSYVMSVSMDRNVRSMETKLTKALLNIIKRRHHDNTLSKPLLAKEANVEKIVNTMILSGEQITEEVQREVDELLTVPEKQKLKEIHHADAMYHQAECELVQTYFIFWLFLEYCSNEMW